MNMITSRYLTRQLVSCQCFQCICQTDCSTGLYGYDGVILEVNEASQVVTVMLF
jgi:hypothetical protein